MEGDKTMRRRVLRESKDEVRKGHDSHISLCYVLSIFIRPSDLSIYTFTFFPRLEPLESGHTQNRFPLTVII